MIAGATSPRTGGRRFVVRAARIDSTVVEADICYATDLGLAQDAARALAREATRARGLAGAGAPRVSDRSRAIAGRLLRLNRSIAARTGHSKPLALRLTGEAGELLAQSVRQARRLAARLRECACGRGADTKLAAASRLERLAERAEKVCAQIGLRLAGESIRDRLVSISDPDPRPIRKGKLRTPTEFGHVMQLTELCENTRRGARGLILPAGTGIGSPNEGHLLPATGQRLHDLDLRPREIALDGGFTLGPVRPTVARTVVSPGLGLVPATRVASAETVITAPGRACPGPAKRSWAAAAVTLTALGLSVRQLGGSDAVVNLAIAVGVGACLLALAVVARRRGSVIQRRARELAMQRDTILSLALQVLEQHDPRAARHAAAVAHHARVLGRAAGLSESDQRIAYAAGLLHDIGLHLHADGRTSGAPPPDTFDPATVRAHPLAGASCSAPCPTSRTSPPWSQRTTCASTAPAIPKVFARSASPRRRRIIAIAEVYDATRPSLDGELIAARRVARHTHASTSLSECESRACPLVSCATRRRPIAMEAVKVTVRRHLVWMMRARRPGDGLRA